MRRFLIILTVLFMARQSRSFDDQLLISLSAQIKQNLRQTLRAGINDMRDLQIFQKSILTMRNVDCLTLKNIDFEDLESKQKFNDLLHFVKNSKEEINISALAEQFDSMCLDAKRYVEFYNNNLTSENLKDLSEVILAQLGNPGCNICASLKERKKRAIAINNASRADLNDTASLLDANEHSMALKVWGYGLLATSLIVASSFSGAFLYPLTKHKLYKKVLMLLISLAIGTLAGTAFLHLIPQAFGISEDEDYSENNAYIWKALVIAGGLYLFLTVEQIMRFCIQIKKVNEQKKL